MKYQAKVRAPEQAGRGDMTRKLTKRLSRSLPLVVPFESLGAGASVLKAKLTVYYCREDNTGACLIKTLRRQIPIKVTANKNAATKIDLTETLAADN